MKKYPNHTIMKTVTDEISRFVFWGGGTVWEGTVMMTTNKNTPVSPGQIPHYCLDRAKGQAGNLLWGVVMLFLGFCVGVYGITEIGADKTGWDYMEYIKMVIGLAFGLGLLVLGGCMIFVALRDSLRPGESTLARSIRSQLPNPEAAPDWQELFAMVDRDLAAGANWFEKVGIGREWILGDEASYIPNIRGVYGRNEVHHRSNGGLRRITQLLIVDNRQQHFVTDMMDYRELEAAIQCLRLRAPDAEFGNYGDYNRAIGLSQDDWDRREQDFRIRQAKRGERSVPTPAPAGEVSGFFVVQADGQRTSRVSRELLARQMEALAPGQQFILNVTDFIPAGMGAVSPTATEVLTALNCSFQGDGRLWLIAILKVVQEKGEELHRGFARIGISKEEALAVMTGLVESRRAPDVFGEGWQAVQVQAAQNQGEQEQHLPYLNITDGAGVSRKYQRFSRRDVELAAQKVADGSYQSAILRLPPRLIFLDGGTKEDARVTIQIALPKNGAFRTYREKTTGRQAAEWFVSCLDGALPEGFDRWKEVTKEWEKRVAKMEKQEKKNANKK